MTKYPREISDRDSGWPLVGLTEIAMAAGVQKPVVAMWRKRHADFPRPVATLTTGAVWFWPDMAEWLVSTGRRTDAGLSRVEVNRASGSPIRSGRPASNPIEELISHSQLSRSRPS